MSPAVPGARTGPKKIATLRPAGVRTTSSILNSARAMAGRDQAWDRRWRAGSMRFWNGLSRGTMTDEPIELDQRRGMAAQKATGSRRLLAQVEANEHTCASGARSSKPI